MKKCVKLVITKNSPTYL